MDSFFYEDNLVLRTETKEDRKARGYMKFLWKRRDRSMCQSLIISGMFWMNEVSYNVASGRKVLVAIRSLMNAKSLLCLIHFTRVKERG